jgi:tetratricopeptide (TPR) repeat protein
VPVHAISSAVQANAAWLQHVAHRSGGRYVDLVAEAPRAAADKLLNDFERVLSASSDGAVELKLVSPYPRGERLAIVGVLLDPQATLRITLGLPGRAPRTIAVPLGKGTSESALAASFWARARVAELEADYSVNRNEILRVGRSFGIVTRETSLIVLEFIQDYVRFEIEPPQELMAQYEQMRRGMNIAVLDRSRKIEQVVALFREKEAWWKRDFPRGRGPAPVEDRPVPRSENVRPGLRAMEGDVVRSAPPPVSRPAPDLMMRQEARVPAAKALAMPEARSRADALGASEALREAMPARSLEPFAARRWAADAQSAMARLRGADAQDAYRIYLDERPGFAASPAFFVDAADVMAAKGLHGLALRVLSNLAEIDLENRHVLRTLGHRLAQAGEAGHALAIFKRVAELAPEEPQSFRDLGLAYAAAGDRQRAVDALYEVVARPWHNRFPQIELVALADLNAIATAGKGKVDVSRIDPRLLKNLPLDLRIVLTWDADNTDINLAVTDPNGQQSYPGGPVTYQGGRASMNFFGGYGPEEYSLRAAKPGTYRIAAHFVGHRQQVVGAGATHAHVRVYTKFGTPEQSERAFSVLLARPGDAPTVTEIVIPGQTQDD